MNMYQTIAQNTTSELVEKKSKFIGNLFYVENKLEAEAKIKELKNKFFDARHNCFAFRVLENETIYEKASDDGEPSGTAGSPMLNILQKNNLCNVLIVVTRYFGGILLGTGGLVRCYAGATIAAVERADIVKIELGTEFKIQIDYANFQNFQYYCQKKDIKIIESNYEENITCHIIMNNLMKQQFLEDIKNRELAISNLKELQTKYIRI